MNRFGIEATIREQIGNELSCGIQAFGKDRVRRWFLRRGMEFGSPWIWWGDVSKSRQESYGGGRHEGVDFAVGEMIETGRVEAGLEGLRVPVFTAGRVLWCFADLVGDTVIVATDRRLEDFRLVIQYSHIDFENVALGDRIEAGTEIGKIELSIDPKSITAPHLHLSIALLREELISLAPGEVDFTKWLHWESGGRLVYLDPLQLLTPEIRGRLFVTGDAANSPISSLVVAGPTREDRLRLRQALARNFPGVRTVSRSTESDAVAMMDRRGLLVAVDGELWRIDPGPDLEVPPDTRLSDTGYSDLIESIRILETGNS
ncbi:MAG: hypothetical protein DRP71_09760 [Verrucomicrobia bacterium]|nr:MAG: hypothetical protein DRP71_09760 [Verrucomicrobiota bacterium]